MRTRKNVDYKLRFLILAVCCITVFVLSFFLGRFSVSFITTMKILADRVVKFITFGKLGLPQTWTSAEYAVVVNVRLPRIVCAALVGASLSVAGVCYQGMFHNPLVSPDLLGASTGSGFGAAIAIMLGGSYFATTLSSFAFGLAAVLLAYAVSRASKIQTTLAMVLSGMMISALFSSATSFVKLVADTDGQLPAITYWLMGSLASVKMQDLHFALVPIALGLVPLILLRWRINLLTVSDTEARSMGVETGKLRFVVILCATLITAGSVSISGMIGWVGLLIPHFCRMVFGQDYKRLVPSSALLGATFLMVVDNIARIATTSEIPIGILTSFVGAPVFISLILTGGTKRED